MGRNTDIEQLVKTMVQATKLMLYHPQDTHEDRAATMLQFSALQLLKEHANSTVTDLATALKLSKSSATQLIERLERTNLVKRINDKTDRRIVRLVITSAGEKQHAELKEKIIGRATKMLSKIPASDLKELLRINKTLLETLKSEQN